jgi:hypothetical protein
MKKTFLLYLVLTILPLGAFAQEEDGYAIAEQLQPQELLNTIKKKTGLQAYSGFSGGMLLHAGYLFSDSPDKVFSNTGLGSADYVKGLPNDGFCFGLGGELRVHLINHLHVGAEGHVSMMPLMKSGSNVRTGWGGAFCDFYANWGKVQPIAGLGVGGGVMKRLFVPETDPTSDGAGTTYNASYAKTPFFYLDPYIGMEIPINTNMAVILRIDYMLPFGVTNSSLVRVAENVNWSKFMTPSGPRLYVGIMFGQFQPKSKTTKQQ